MYKCKHFSIHELVPPDIFRFRGQDAWELLDDRLLITLDNLRDRYGSITVNNYYWGGHRKFSGLRTPDSPDYSPTSQHSHGRAADCLFKHVSAEEVRQDILANPNSVSYEYIGGLELNTSWLHFDTRNCNRIKTFRP